MRGDFFNRFVMQIIALATASKATPDARLTDLAMTSQSTYVEQAAL
jgi:hypothetical protein